MLHGLCFGEEAGARNLVFFRVKWLQPTMTGTSCVRRVWLRSVCRFFLPQCNGGLKLLWVCLCVRSYRVFWNLRLQIALEWLHDCCHLVLLCVLIRAGLRRDAAKRMVMAASRLLGAAAACVILLSFAGEDCKSYWSGCIQAATVICQKIVAILALVLKLLLKSASKWSFFRFGVDFRF